MTFLSAAVGAADEGPNATRRGDGARGAARHGAAVSVPALRLTMGSYRIAMPHPSLTPAAGSHRDRPTFRRDGGARGASCRQPRRSRTLRLDECRVAHSPARTPSSPTLRAYSTATAAKGATGRDASAGSGQLRRGEARGIVSWGLASPARCAGHRSLPVRNPSLTIVLFREPRCARSRRDDRRNILNSQYLTSATSIGMRGRAAQKRRKLDFGPAAALGSVMMPPYRREAPPLGRQLTQGESRCHGKR
jgi:hypothetical protein